MARTIEHRYDWVRRPYGVICFDTNEWNLYETLVVDGEDVATENVAFVTWHGERRARKDRPSPIIGDLFGGCVFDLNAPGTDESNWCEVYTLKEAMRFCERGVGATRANTTKFG